MIHYLDTSTLKGEINSLVKLSRTNNIYLSGYNLIELYSQINEISFEKSLTLFKKIEGSYLKIDWRLPDDVLAKTYNLRFRFSKIKLIKNLFQNILSSNNYNEFKSKSKIENLNYIDFYDKLFSPDNDKTQSQENQFIAKAYEQVFLKSHKSDDYKKDLLSDEIIKILSERTSKSLLIYLLGPLTKTNKNIETIDYYHNLYNGKLECFCYAFAYFKLLKYSEKNTIGRNDYNDLTHLVYLENIKSKKYFLYNDKIYSNLGSNLNSKLKLFREFPK
ncbi:hypothetical protein LPTSP2_39310 [Leptospira ellinghausenii]|uniref:Uncharacterized protein n=1 Tax=Leptospira ellinghausenii TaxID=1917822 RepID=A0A2P2DJ13_9LEPT|nr:hypothetical protein [Leptospira ellinghausenii]GBF44628.1 hypothetical protein LPTSP2_39310 [Leptospira ellinghausenii]